MQARIALPDQVDVDQTLARYALWGHDPVNRLGTREFRRAVEVGGCWRVYRLTWDGQGDNLQLSVPDARSARVVDAALGDARHVLGLDFDLGSFYRAAAGDRVLASLVRQLTGLRPTLSPRPFEMLVGSVCAQQVNLAFAFTVRARLVCRYGVPVDGDGAGEPVYAFPEPAVLARAAPAELRAMQFTVRKAEYIIGLARQIATGELDLAAIRERSNDEIIKVLTSVRGFGRWTAEWFLARGLGRGDVCPAGDLGVRRAFEHFYGRGRELSEAAIRRRAAAWGPNQNLAVHYLLAGQRLASAPGGEGA